MIRSPIRALRTGQALSEYLLIGAMTCISVIAAVVGFTRIRILSDATKQAGSVTDGYEYEVSVAWAGPFLALGLVAAGVWIAAGVRRRHARRPPALSALAYPWVSRTQVRHLGSTG